MEASVMAAPISHSEGGGMNKHAPQLFVPPRPAISERTLSGYQSLVAFRWPKEAYTEDILAQSFIRRRRFLLNSGDAIHRVLVDNIANYKRTSAAVRILRPMVGEGLILSEGDEWRHQRRTIAPSLSPRVIPLLARHVAAATAPVIAALAASASEPVELLATMQLLTLEIASRSMFSLEIARSGPALRRLMAEFSSLAQPHPLDLLLPIGIPNWRDLARSKFRKRWIAFMDDIASARMSEPASDQPRDLFDLLVAARDPETGAAFSRAQLRDQMSTMIVAGHETTALTLFWAFYLLASAPAEQDRVAHEVGALDLSVEAAATALPKLPYTGAVVNETLRLYPPAPAVARRAIATDEVDGTTIPGGSLVTISPWVLHRHLRLWNNPEAFDPSRFLGDTPLAHRYAYMPFGAGPRVCVGARFALAEVGLVLAMLIQKFEIGLADDTPVLPKITVTTYPDHPVRFRLRARG
jgi:unspecific monooxygenase